MVPHRRILQAIALVASTHPDPSGRHNDLCEQFSVRFPGPMEEFLQVEVYSLLPEHTEVLLKTTDVRNPGGPQTLLQAASLLDLSTLILFDYDGPTVTLPGEVGAWRSDPTKRLFIETCLLANVSHAYIVEDLRRMYGIDVAERDVEVFADLFCDVAYSQGEGWAQYTQCISEAEANFKLSLRNQPAAFVRWKLGAPVPPDLDLVLDRLIADSYFTERVIKARAGDHGIALGKNELARIKMERDTLFKALDRRIKKQELDRASGGGSEAKEAAEHLKAIVLQYSTDLPPLASEVFNAE